MAYPEFVLQVGIAKAWKFLQDNAEIARHFLRTMPIERQESIVTWIRETNLQISFGVQAGSLGGSPLLLISLQNETTSDMYVGQQGLSEVGRSFPMEDSDFEKDDFYDLERPPKIQSPNPYPDKGTLASPGQPAAENWGQGVEAVGTPKKRYRLNQGRENTERDRLDQKGWGLLPETIISRKKNASVQRAPVEEMQEKLAFSWREHRPIQTTRAFEDSATFLITLYAPSEMCFLLTRLLRFVLRQMWQWFEGNGLTNTVWGMSDLGQNETLAPTTAGGALWGRQLTLQTQIEEVHPEAEKFLVDWLVSLHLEIPTFEQKG